MTPPVKAPPAPRRAEASSGDTPAIDPRIQARRDAVQTEELRRRRLLLLSATAVLVAVVLGWSLTRTSVVAVRTVRVMGAVHTGNAAVLAAAGLDHPRQMTDLSPSALARRIDALPWVASARVVRHYPTTVDVFVTERRAVAFAADSAGGWAVLDAGGRVLEVDLLPPPGIVAVTLAPPANAGPTVPTALAGAPGSSARDELGPALQVAAALMMPLASDVQTIVANLDGSVSISLRDGGVGMLGMGDQLTEKLTALGTVVTKAKVGKGMEVDVSVPTAPVVRPLTAS